MDLGWSFHIGPNRDWFSTYEAIASGVVLMGNNATCKVVGIRSMHVKMHDGIIRTIIDVCYVSI